MIEVHGIERRFGPTVALAGVSFEIGEREVVGLLGPNGAGKTTCMRILAGFLPPTAGVARVAGFDVVAESLAARRQIGYLPDGVPVYPELRVREYLAFRARLRRVRRRQLTAEVDRAIALCQLTQVERRIVGQLSRGYRQRLGIADVLLGRPPVLVLDEPTAGLDPNQIREVRDLLRALASEHTILLSSHILAQVEAVCARALILDRGRIVASGSLSQLRAAGGGERITLVVRGPAGQVCAGVARIEDVELLEHEVLSTAPEVIRLSLAGAIDPALRERIAAAVAAGGWALQELASTPAPLDEVFARLTATEAEPA